MRLRGMDTVEQRLDMVRAIEDYGLTATEAAQLWGVSRETWHKWRRRYDSEGIAGLEARAADHTHGARQRLTQDRLLAELLGHRQDVLGARET